MHQGEGSRNGLVNDQANLNRKHDDLPQEEETLAVDEYHKWRTIFGAKVD